VKKDGGASLGTSRHGQHRESIAGQRTTFACSGTRGVCTQVKRTAMNLSTASNKASIDAGFRRKAVQHPPRSVGSGMDDSRTTGKSGKAASRLRRRQSSPPSISGISKSVMTSSGNSAWTFRSASRPLCASTTRYPRLSSTCCSAHRFSRSSSTSRIVDTVRHTRKNHTNGFRKPRTYLVRNVPRTAWSTEFRKPPSLRALARLFHLLSSPHARESAVELGVKNKPRARLTAEQKLRESVQRVGPSRVTASLPYEGPSCESLREDVYFLR